MQQQYNPAADPLIKALRDNFGIPIPTGSPTLNMSGYNAAYNARGSGHNAAVGSSQSSGAKRPLDTGKVIDAPGLNKRHQQEQPSGSSVAPQPGLHKSLEPVCTVSPSI